MISHSNRKSANVISHSRITSYDQSRYDVISKIKPMNKNCNIGLNQDTQPNIVEKQQLTEQIPGVKMTTIIRKEADNVIE